MTSPPYLDLGFALRIDCAKCARYKKVTVLIEIVPAHKNKELDLEQVVQGAQFESAVAMACLLYTSPSPRDRQKSRMPSSA